MAWLYKQTNSKFWYIAFRVNRKLRAKSTGKTERKQAEAVLADFISIENAKKGNRINDFFFKAFQVEVPDKKPIKAAMEEWLTECKRSTAPGTYARYETVSEQFCNHVKADDKHPLLRDVRTADVTGFLNAQSKTLSPSSVNLSRKILSTFFNRAMANGLCDANPVAATKRAKQDGKRSSRRPYTVQELRDMLKSASPFWRYMILGELYTGLRMGDLICMRRDEINLEVGTLRARMGKTGAPINIPIISPSFRAEITLRLHALGPVKGDTYLWPEHAARYIKQGAGSFSNEFYVDILVPIGLVPARTKKHKKQKHGRGVRRELNATTFHSLRHTFVSMLQSVGASKAITKELAGHSSEAINDIYTHSSPEDIRRVVALLPEVIPTGQ